jgi:two-component system, NtrC family, sensor histidine kinase KinB
MSLRQRILLALIPLVLLPAILGAVGMVLLYHLGYRSDAILRENYDSVRAMYQLDLNLDRIDTSFRLALLNQEKQAHEGYTENWKEFDTHFHTEQNNITILPEEQVLVNELEGLKKQYRELGDQFYQMDLRDPRREQLYHEEEPVGLHLLFDKIRMVARAIRLLNQDHMEHANRQAQETARVSVLRLGIGLLAGAVFAGLAALGLMRSLVPPIEALTRAARAASEGRLGTDLPETGAAELGQLTRAFNELLARLRDYRQSNSERLLRSQQTSQATIDSFPDPVVVVDPEGRVDLANPAARSLLGVVPLKGSDPSAPPWQPPDSLRQPLLDALREQKMSKAETFAEAVTFRLGEIDRTFLPQVRPIRDPYERTLGAAVVLTDVTRFRLLDQLKSDLVATVSHELKTPLTSLRLGLHLLLEETVGPLTPKQTELLLDARENAERLRNMVEQLLNLARLEDGRRAMHTQATASAALLRAAADQAAPRAEGKHLTLTVSESDHLPPVAADPVRMGQALNNLVDNAVAYTEPGGKVTLSATEAPGNMVRITVADSGRGIPTQYLPHIFEKFFQVPGDDRPKGTGLGLSIVREIVTAHGGRVSCESKPGQGTWFHLDLPVWKEDSHAPLR